MYAKLENDKLVYAPKNYNTGTNMIINFNKNIKLMQQYGFKAVIENYPVYDNTTHYISVEGYTENEDNIIINYTINELEMVNKHTLEERVIELEMLVKEQTETINTLLVTLNVNNK